MNKNNNLKLSVMIALMSLLMLPNCAFASFDLAYTLTEGGYRLELNPANLYKGVKIDVTSTLATRYEIIQKIITPLENRQDPTINIRDNFVVRGLRGTNQYGNLRVPTEDNLVKMDEIVYVSDTGGSADSFTLVYGIARVEDIRPGDYFGRISFTLRPIDSTLSPVTKILDVYVTITQKGEVVADIEISPVTGFNTITLNSKKEEMQKFDVEVKINSKFKNLFTIKQLLVEPLTSMEGDELDYPALDFVVIEANIGRPVNMVTPFSSRQMDIYASEADGSSVDSFIITYGLGDLVNYKAGTYRSRIQYILEEAGKPVKILKTLGLEIENEPIFDLMILPEEGKTGIDFSNVKPGEPPKKSEITIEVRTNVGKTYQVSQNVYSDLTDTEGNVIPKQYFSLKTESLDTKGSLKFLDKQEVKKGEVVLLVSDGRGSADKFKLIYELASSWDIRAGNYSTRITYSLSEI